jgi:FkbH-like protein
MWELLKHLRDTFGKPTLTEEDAMRLRSIRNAAAWRKAIPPGEGASDDFLRDADASLVFDGPKTTDDARTLELVNKTNQFNLNGRRFSEAEWKSFLDDSAAFLLTASYRDKFGPLGKIAVILGKVRGRTATISSWVMSCRAFSRRIEHQCLKHIFETMDVEEIEFEYKATARNEPLQEFFAEFLSPLQPGVRLTKAHFEAKVPQLYHRVERATYV